MKYFISLLFCVSLNKAQLHAQGCSLVTYYVSPSANSIDKSDTTVCKNSPLNLFASIPSLKETTSYTVAAVPYMDILPCETTGSVIGGSGINQDDQYSPLQNIGFNFCFWGNQHNQLTINDNGYLTFTLSKAGTNFSPFSSVALPLPSASAIPPNTIFGAMMDVLVATNYTPPGGGTISVQGVGAAPFRAFIIKWDDCRYFTTGCRSNPSVRYNVKIVLYETTNMIDIYIKTKPLCTVGASTVYNCTQGFVGPNITTQFMVTPGRNNSLWDGANSAFRFTPNGSAYSTTVNWTKNGTSVGSSNVLSISSFTDDSATFIATTNISATCPTATLIVKDTIKVYGLNNTAPSTKKYDTIRCIDSITLNNTIATAKKYKWNTGDTTPSIKVGNTGLFYVVRTYDTFGCNRDTIIHNVTKSLNPKIDSFKRIGCFNSTNSGKLKLYVSGDITGAKYGTISYPLSSSDTILSQKYGTQKYYVRNVGLCVDSITISHDSITNVFTKRQNYCNQDSSGMMRLTVSGGYSPFTYNLTGKSPQPIDSFNGLGTGIYTISATDKNGCLISRLDSIVPNTNLMLTISTDSVFCFGANTGKITASLTGGLPNYKYSINNGPFFSSGIFTTLTAGIYTIKTKDSAKCERDTSITIYQNSQINFNSAVTKNCPFNANGSIVVSALGGKPSYQYQLNAAPYQASNSFTNLINGIYVISVKDSKNCIFSKLDTVTSYLKPDLNLTYKKNLSCYQSNNGIIKVNTISGSAPYIYAWSIAGTLDSVTNLAIGTYTVTVTDANSCKDTLSTIVTQPDTISSTSVLTHPLCFNQSSGKVKIFASGATPPYQYSINGGSYSSTDSFIGLSNGANVYSIRDSNLCSKNFNFNLINPTKLAVTIVVDSAKCFGGNNGKITVTGLAATPPYRYKINAGIYTSTNIFNGLVAANYTLSLRDTNNCQLDTNATVNQFTPVNFTINLVDTIRCKNGNDGKISISPSGGKAPYQYSINGGGYQISNVFSNLNKGKKIISVKDTNNCIKVDSFIMIEPPGISSTLTIANHVKCFGESNAKAKIAVVGGTLPYTYSWSNGATIDSVVNFNFGLKFINISDGRNCKDSIAFTITQPDTLKSNFNLYHPLCYNTLGSIKAIGIGGTIPHKFSFNGGGYTSLDSFSNLTGQIYSIIIRDSNLCTTGYSRTLITPTQIQANYAIDSVQCFGAPSGKITITGLGGTAPLTFFKNTVLQPSNVFSGLTANTYAVRVKDNNNCIKDTNLTVYQYPDITVNYPTTNVNCFGASTGSITINATGGAGGLIYAIDASAFGANNVFNTLVAGTYNMKVRDQYACQKSQNIVVTQIDSMQISISKSNNLCFGDALGKFKLSVINGTAPYQYSFNGGAYSTLDSQTNLVIGTYAFTVKDANGCIKTGSVSITQPPKLGIITPFVDSVKCFKVNQGRIQVIGNGGTPVYTYAINSGAYSGSNNFPLLSAGNYYLQVKDANQCVKDTTVTIFSSDSLYHTLVIDSLKCNSQAIGKVTISVVGGKPTYEYRIDGNPYGVLSILTGIGPGPHTIYTRDNYNCIFSTNIDLPNPPAINTVLDSVVHNKCFGNSLGKIKITSSGGKLPHTYLWTNGAITNNNINLGANNYTLSVTDANGCEVTSNYVVNQPTDMTYAMTKTNVLCSGQSNGSIQVTIGGATPPYSYLWSNAMISSSISNLVDGNYTITVTDKNLCTTTRTYSVTQPGAMAFSLSRKHSSCFESQDGEISIIALSGGTSPYSYNWSNGQTGVTKISSLPAFSNYKVTVVDNNGCFKIDTSSIDTVYKIRAKFSFISYPKCANSPVSFELKPSSGIPPYQQRANLFPIQDTSRFLNYPNNIYKITIRDSKNCLYDTTVDMIPQDTMVTKLTTYNPKCETGNIFTSKHKVTGGLAPYTYSWPGAMATFFDSAWHDTKGFFNVIVKDANNCIVTTKFYLNPPEFALSATIGNKLNLRCYNIPEGKMKALAIGGSTPYRYKWNIGDTTAEITNLPANLRFKVTVTDALNCNFIVYDSLTQPDSMRMSLVVNDKSCVNSNDATIAVKSYGGTAPNKFYSYALDSLGPYLLRNYFLTLKEGYYKVYQRDENKCIKRLDTFIVVKNKAILSLDSVYKLYLTQTVDLLPNIVFIPNSSNVKYQWIPSEGLSCADCLNPTVNSYISRKYSLVVHYGNGCLDTVSTKVYVENDKLDFYVPKAFTSGSQNAENRVFKAYGNYIGTFKMSVYNRWGEKVFESNNIEHGWDGKYKDALVPMGIYSYIIEAYTLDKRNIRQVGSVEFFY